MTLLKQLLHNEIKSVLGNTPTDKEFASAIEYIKENVSEKDHLIDVELIARDWLHDKCVKCAGCGEFHLREDCINAEGRWFCNESCINAYCWENGLLYDSDADCFIER